MFPAPWAPVSVDPTPQSHQPCLVPISRETCGSKDSARDTAVSWSVDARPCRSWRQPAASTEQSPGGILAADWATSSPDVIGHPPGGRCHLIPRLAAVARVGFLASVSPAHHLLLGSEAAAFVFNLSPSPEDGVLSPM